MDSLVRPRRPRPWPTLLAALLLTLFHGVRVGAQETTGDVRGIVLTEAGEPLAVAMVVLEGPHMPGLRSALTDARGRFTVAGLPPGTYSARVEHLGYRSLTIRSVPVYLGAVTELEPFRLRVEPVLLEPLVVESATLMIDPVSTAAGMYLPEHVFSSLPVERDYSSLLSLVPQVSRSHRRDGVNVAGSTGSENVYFIDGVNVTDPHLASGGISLPHNFIREIRVAEGGYQAEHGRALGAVVDAVTRTGGETFEVEAFGHVLNDGLATDARSGVVGLRATGFSDYDVGASVGGPLGEKARFFAAYNGRFQTRDMGITGFPHETDRRVTQMFAGRLDWRVAAETDLVVTVVGDPSEHETVDNPWVDAFGAPEFVTNVDPLLGHVRDGGVTASIRARSARWNGLLLEGGLAFYRANETMEGRTERARSEPLFMYQGPDEPPFWEGGFGLFRDNVLVRYSTDLEATWFRGRHTVKAGLAYEENVVDIDRRLTEPGVLLDRGSIVLALINTGRGRVKNRVPSVFVQDSWAVTDDLTLNVGLRWDGQFFYGAGDTLAQSIRDQYQPRLGLVWRPKGGGTRIFGSVGRYYQQLPLHLSTDQHSLFENLLVFYPEDPRSGSEPVRIDDYSAREAPRSPPIDGLEGEHFDEVVGGLETSVFRDTRLVVRGLHRDLREAYILAVDPETGQFVSGNMGRGALDFLPEPERRYTALEVTAERLGGEGFRWMASYTLSRSRGNYTGLFASDANVHLPGNAIGLQMVEQIENGNGRLPSDRPHLFKLFGAYGSGAWTAGTFLLVQSGAPLNEFAPTPLLGRPRYLVRRGYAGRAPTLWDLSFRFTYDATTLRHLPGSARLVADLLHVGSPRRAVRIDQWKFLAADENGVPTTENPTFGKPLAHQPPTMLRLGVQWSW